MGVGLRLIPFLLVKLILTFKGKNSIQTAMQLPRAISAVYISHMLNWGCVIGCSFKIDAWIYKLHACQCNQDYHYTMVRNEQQLALFLPSVRHAATDGIFTHIHFWLVCFCQMIHRLHRYKTSKSSAEDTSQE